MVTNTGNLLTDREKYLGLYKIHTAQYNSQPAWVKEFTNTYLLFTSEGKWAFTDSLSDTDAPIEAMESNVNLFEGSMDWGLFCTAGQRRVDADSRLEMIEVSDGINLCYYLRSCFCV